ADIAWGVIASFIIGNIILLILNLPLIRIWVKILKIPYGLLFAVILGFMILGAYSVNNSVFEIMVMLCFGIFAFFMKKMEFPMAPLILTLILGPQMERALRQSLEISQGSFSVFIETPLSAALFSVAALILIAPAFKLFRKGKEKVSGAGV
ncbi:MAG: hypothetical protein FD137_1504, partial [Spirochaetes bacterium]